MISDFKKKKNTFINRAWLVILVVITLAVFVSLAVANIKIYQKRQKFISQIEDLKIEIENLKNRNNYLKEAILKTDDKDYIEKMAREELNLQKPGERVVSFIDVANGQFIPDTSKDKNYWQFWPGWVSGSWNWLKNQFSK